MTAGLPIDLAMVVAVALVVSVLLYLIRRERRETAAREMAVAELRESESKFRFIAENSGDVIWVMDIASWHNTYVSPSVYRLRGYTREEAMAQPVEAVMTPESLQRVKSILAEAIGRWEAGERTDAVRVVELDQPHKDGHLIATEVVATLHANAQGKLVSVLGVTRDITERKRTEQAIRQLAFHDPLTQLPNRRLLLDRLPQLISRTKREQSRLALLFIDLDRFKPINDEQGHEVGDWLLQSVAQRSCSIAQASVEEIEQHNILQATLLAMRRAVEGLRLKPMLVLVDGNRLPVLSMRAEAIVKGDALVSAISAASILAKVQRDHWCAEIDKAYPQYGFARHKGYGTAEHLAALKVYGACPLHRRTFRPVADILRELVA